MICEAEPIHCRRGYTAARYQRIIDNIRRYMPNASVSGDAIVGFPGETEEQFQATCRCLPNHTMSTHHLMR